MPFSGHCLLTGAAGMVSSALALSFMEREVMLNLALFPGVFVIPAYGGLSRFAHPRGCVVLT